MEAISLRPWRYEVNERPIDEGGPLQSSLFELRPDKSLRGWRTKAIGLLLDGAIEGFPINIKVSHRPDLVCSLFVPHPSSIFHLPSSLIRLPSSFLPLPYLGTYFGKISHIPAINPASSLHASSMDCPGATTNSARTRAPSVRCLLKESHIR